jgi:PKD repeat protein
VTQTFTLDGIAFGQQTFVFDGFTDLIRVEWNGGTPHQFDNIVLDSAPGVAEANGDYTVAEGGSVDLTAAGSADADGIAAYEWDFDYDGVSFDVDATGPNVSYSAVGLDGPGTRTVALRLRDNLGGYSNVDTAAVHITNVTPSAVIVGPGSALEGDTVTFGGTFTDPGGPADGAYTYSWSVAADNGQSVPGASGTVAVDPGFAVPDFSFTASDDGIYTVTLTVTDKDGESAAVSHTLRVGNSAPVLTAPADQSAAEGAAATIDLGSFSDAGTEGSWSVTVDWGDGTSQSFDLTAAGDIGALSHTYADSGSYVVSLTVGDGTEASATTFAVAAANAAPAAELSSSGPVKAGEAATVSFANAADPSPGDTAAGFRYSFALDAAGLAVDYASAGASASAPFTFASAGTYTVHGRVFDADGAFRDYTTTVIVEAATEPPAPEPVPPVKPFVILGVHAALTDVTGDGVRDLVLGHRVGGQRLEVRIFDGASHREIFRLTPYGTQKVDRFHITLEDRDGDGLREVVITAPSLPTRVFDARKGLYEA